MNRELAWKVFSELFDVNCEDAEFVNALFNMFLSRVENKSSDSNKCLNCDNCVVANSKSTELLNDCNDAIEAAVKFNFWNDKCKKNCAFSETYILKNLLVNAMKTVEEEQKL